jgi:hypothetical protein
MSIRLRKTLLKKGYNQETIEKIIAYYEGETPLSKFKFIKSGEKHEK